MRTPGKCWSRHSSPFSPGSAALLFATLQGAPDLHADDIVVI
jgi:hypothetical protein